MRTTTVLRRAAALTLAVTMASGASNALADTTMARDARQPIGGHDIVRLVADNNGDRVGATVGHRGRRWQGRVRLEFDVSGNRAPEYVAVIRRKRPTKAVFTRRGGAPWRCPARTVASRLSATRTVLHAPRRCFAMAPRMRVRAVAATPRRRSDAAATPVVVQQRRPNIIMIMVDDMRADDLAYMPWTRRLIGDRGVHFRNSFSPFPLCCPARASMLTGQYSHNHEVLGVHEPYGFNAFDDDSTLATWLKRSGYATVYLGKYLNHYGEMPEPGKDTGKSLRYVPPGWSDWRASIDGGLPSTHPKRGSTYAYDRTTLSVNGNGFVNYNGRYQTNVYGALTEDIIEQRSASDRPFFLFASYTAPHAGGPIEPDDPGSVRRDDGAWVDFGTPARPASVEGMFDAVIDQAPGFGWLDHHFDTKPAHVRRLPAINDAEWDAMRNLTRQRAESLHVVDLQVKRSIDALTASGELEETLVVFTSDNGFMLGEQRMRKGKVVPYDPSLRVPVLMRGPGIPAGENRFDPFLSIDFAPTFTRLAGVPTPDSVDGVSMLGVARHGDRGWTRPVLTEAGPMPNVHVEGAEDDPEALIRTDFDPDRELHSIIGVRTDRYLYLNLASGEEELYDMAEDPEQTQNLVGVDGYDETHAALRAELENVADCAGRECRTTMTGEDLVTSPGESIVRFRRRAR